MNALGGLGNAPHKGRYPAVEGDVIRVLSAKGGAMTGALGFLLSFPIGR
jgi:hypothetical protein